MSHFHTLQRALWVARRANSAQPPRGVTLLKFPGYSSHQIERGTTRPGRCRPRRTEGEEGHRNSFLAVYFRPSAAHNRRGPPVLTSFVNPFPPRSPSASRHRPASRRRFPPPSSGHRYLDAAGRPLGKQAKVQVQQRRSWS